VPAGPSPRRSPRRRPPAVTRSGPGGIGFPMRRADGSSAHDAQDARRRSLARSPRCPPNGDPMRPGSPVRSPLRPPTPGGSPTVPAGVHLVVLRPLATRHPRRWPFTLSSPGPAQVATTNPERTVGGAGRPSDAWNRPRCWPSTRCPTPTPRCGGSASRSMTPTSNRSGPESSARPRCWFCGACPSCGASANRPWLTRLEAGSAGPSSEGLRTALGGG
jgi:hypothetical protein